MCESMHAGGRAEVQTSRQTLITNRFLDEIKQTRTVIDEGASSTTVKSFRVKVAVGV